MSSDPNRTVELGDRVFYRENGKTNKGTIVDILLDDSPFVVKWDNGPEQERLDQFSGSQLAFLE
jgi:hypothetical protein